MSDPINQDSGQSGAPDDEEDPVDPASKCMYNALLVTCKRLGDESAFGESGFGVVDDRGDHT